MIESIKGIGTLETVVFSLRANQTVLRGAFTNIQRRFKNNCTTKRAFVSKSSGMLKMKTKLLQPCARECKNGIKHRIA
eukprot:10205_6